MIKVSSMILVRRSNVPTGILARRLGELCEELTDFNETSSQDTARKT